MLLAQPSGDGYGGFRLIDKVSVSADYSSLSLSCDLQESGLDCLLFSHHFPLPFRRHFQKQATGVID